MHVFPLRSLFKESVSSVDSRVSQCIPPHGVSEKIPHGGVHLNNQGRQGAHHHVIVQCDSNPALSQSTYLEPHKIHTKAIYFAQFSLFPQIDMLKIKTSSTMMGPSRQEHFLSC